jgi:hypothetical protein
MDKNKNDPSAEAPLNRALKSETESVYPTKERSPSPYESTSTKANEGGGWPIIWLVVTVVCIALAIYFLV